jgi:iron-sulfur cluster assembly protein
MISLTELAASKVKQNLERRGNGLGIRLGVKTTGCSGLAYVIEYVDQPAVEDMSFVI